MTLSVLPSKTSWTVGLALSCLLAIGGCESDEEPPIVVCSPTIAADPPPPAGLVGQPYDYTLGIDCDCNDATWEVTQGTFVQGLTLADGRISGTPTLSNVYNFTVFYESHCEDVDNAEIQLSIVVNSPPPCAPLGLAIELREGVIDVPYSSDLVREGVNGPETGQGTLTFTVLSGALPPGLQIDDASHLLAGTPTQAGIFDFRLRLTDTCPEINGGQQDDERDYSLLIAAGCEPMVLAGRSFIGTTGVFFERVLVTSGGVSPIAAAKLAGTLPPGINLLNDPPRLRGTPTDAATYTFTLEFTDSCVPAQVAQKEFSFIVNPF